MSTSVQVVAVSKKSSWAGRILSILIVLFMLFDGISKVMKPASVVQGFAQAGWPASLAVTVGVIALVCAVLYAIPSTSILGAILLTGYLGGATASNLRIGMPMIIVFAPVIVGVLAWVALYLRDARLRVLVPVKR
ncbi:MAG: DoxX family protein [Acidobacteriaceae bacterium]